MSLPLAFKRLQEELALAEAPLTQKRIACAIVDETGALFGGHNREEMHPTFFHHAEHEAITHLIQTAPRAKIDSLFLTGSGKAKKFKHIVPCVTCLKELSPFFHDKSTITLLYPNTFDKDITFLAQDLQAVYTPLPYSAVSHQKLQHVTHLTATDADFVARSALRIQQLGGTCFLTGSSSGRSGVHEFLLSRGGEVSTTVR